MLIRYFLDSSQTNAQNINISRFKSQVLNTVSLVWPIYQYDQGDSDCKRVLALDSAFTNNIGRISSNQICRNVHIDGLFFFSHHRIHGLIGISIKYHFLAHPSFFCHFPKLAALSNKSWTIYGFTRVKYFMDRTNHIFSLNIPRKKE